MTSQNPPIVACRWGVRKCRIFGMALRRASTVSNRLIQLKIYDTTRGRGLTAPRALRHDWRMSLPVVPIDRLDIRIRAAAWPFASAARRDRRAFRRAASEAPPIWNGRVLLLHRYGIADGALPAPSSRPTSRASSPGATGAFPSRRAAMLRVGALRAATAPSARRHGRAHRQCREHLFPGRRARSERRRRTARSISPAMSCAKSPRRPD